MESGAASIREQGVRALEHGMLDEALDLLARAVMADGRDAEAKAYLAVAYSRKGLHPQARRAIQNALELRPSQAEYRYLLGTILERENDTEGAATAYRECLRRHPAHPHASGRLELMGVTPLRPDAPAAAAPESASPAAPSPLNQPAPAPGPVHGPRGTLRCPRCMEWSKPGLSCEWCAGPLVPRTAVAAPPIPPPYAAATPLPGLPPVPGPPPAYPGAHPGMGYPPAGTPFYFRRQNRGGSILTLGVLGVIFTLIGFGCGLIALAGMVCSILAWSMANGDLAQIDSGLLDDVGRGNVTTGRVLGIIGTMLSFLLLVGWLIFIASIAAFA